MIKHMIVINIDLKQPFLYKAEIKNDEDILIEVENFFEECSIKVSIDTVDRISSELVNELYSWYCKNICFMLV